MQEVNDVVKILVVDDDVVLRDFYRRILSLQGYMVICCSNGQEALSILQENQEVDLVIVDLLIPAKGGGDLVVSMKNAPELKSIPVIVISGVSVNLAERRRVEPMCQAVVLKGDFEMGRFLELLDRILFGAADAESGADDVTKRVI